LVADARHSVRPHIAGRRAADGGIAVRASLAQTTGEAGKFAIEKKSVVNRRMAPCETTASCDSASMRRRYTNNPYQSTLGEKLAVIMTVALMAMVLTGIAFVLNALS
jgi:hypothetical protein